MQKSVLFFIAFIVSCNFQAQCWKSIATAGDHNIGLNEDGTLWAWGGNLDG
jgi:hypothetical protein